MSPQSIVCATCAATVPYGRLSCPACGELLASVAGAARSVTARTATSQTRGPAAPAVLMDVAPVSVADVPFFVDDAPSEGAGPSTSDDRETDGIPQSAAER